MVRIIFLILISISSFGQMLPIIPATQNQRSGSALPTIIRSLDATWNKFHRVGNDITGDNTSVGIGTFTWYLLDISDPVAANWTVEDQMTGHDPLFADPPLGYYVIYGQVQGLNDDPVGRIFWHLQITVLPALFVEGAADRVLSLDDGNNIFDASSWTDGEQIFLKKIDATVGRIRIDNYTSATRAHLLIDPSSEMEVNTFAGSSGLYLVNCQNILIDAVGTTDAYGLYLNGVGDNTSHGIVINTISDVRCEGIEIYGVKIEVPQTGATGLRMLMDESATYNRSDPPLQNFRFAHIWVVEAGHEGLYLGVSEDADTGNGGPRESEYVWAWDWIVDESSRDALQPCETINSVFHDWVINASGTLGESSHNSYIVHNAGNQNIKIFNVRAKGGIHAISMKFGETGANPSIWNCTFEVETLPSQTTWNFIQVGDAPNTDIFLANITLVASSGDEIVYRFDSGSGTGSQDIDDFTLINCTTIKGTSENLFTKDGTNAETNWDITSGNLTYIPATASTALLDGTTHLPSTYLSPSITGGVAWTTRRTATEMLCDFGTLTLSNFDIEGYVSTNGVYWSGAGSGIELTLDEL